MMTLAIRALVALLTAATLLPFVPVGWWPIRICDFFRLQIAVLAIVLLSLIVAIAGANKMPPDGSLLIVLCVSVAIWQSLHVIPYTRWWKKELADATASDAGTLSVGVVNLKFDNLNRSAVLEQLQRLSVDLLLLIEVNAEWSAALASLTRDYPFHEGVVREDGPGLMLFSRLPLTSSRVEFLVSETRPSIFARARLRDGSEIRFVGVHPLPPGLPKSEEDGRHNSRVRDAELMQIAKIVADEPRQRWLITGDFNDVAWSHTTRMFRRISCLHDPRIGRGLYHSYHADYVFLRFPIDQVFVSPGTRVRDLGRFHPKGSDHFAITASLSFVSSESVEVARCHGDLQEASLLIEEGRRDAPEPPPR